MRNGWGLWKARVKTSSMVMVKKSATGWTGTSRPTPSISTMPLTRGERSKAIISGRG